MFVRVCRAWEVPFSGRKPQYVLFSNKLLLRAVSTVSTRIVHTVGLSGCPWLLALSSSLDFDVDDARCANIICTLCCSHNFEILARCVSVESVFLSLFSVLRFCPRVRKLSSSLFFCVGWDVPLSRFSCCRQIVSHFLFHFVLTAGKEREKAVQESGGVERKGVLAR